MRLLSLSISGLHRALTLDVAFNKEVTLLVGINGSGKTSVLNVIDWLLKPDLPQLAVAEYERLSLEFDEGATAYRLTAAKSAIDFTLSLEGGGAELAPINVQLAKHMLPGDDPLQFYAQLRPEEHERPMWTFLQSLPKPTTIALDRTISAEANETAYVETPQGIRARKARARTPLGYVQDVTANKYAEYRARAIANDEELKAQIVMSALQNFDVAGDGGAGKSLTKGQIAKLEEKVVAYLSTTIKSPEVAEQVRSFFTSTRALARRQKGEYVQEDLLAEFVTSRYRQIESLAKAFNDFETKNAIAFAALTNYLSSVNRFFNDSGKELYFEPTTGRLVYSSVQEGSRQREKKQLSHLSSGERQILILFTFLAFASRARGVFMVDEPELSLHPKWQHSFMETFLKLRPGNTQLLLATHSPDIVGRFKPDCVTLRSRQP